MITFNSNSDNSRIFRSKFQRTNSLSRGIFFLLFLKLEGLRAQEVKPLPNYTEWVLQLTLKCPFVWETKISCTSNVHIHIYPKESLKYFIECLS